LRIVTINPVNTTLFPANGNFHHEGRSKVYFRLLRRNHEARPSQFPFAKLPIISYNLSHNLLFFLKPFQTIGGKTIGVVFYAMKEVAKWKKENGLLPG